MPNDPLCIVENNVPATDDWGAVEYWASDDGIQVRFPDGSASDYPGDLSNALRETAMLAIQEPFGLNVQVRGNAGLDESEVLALIHEQSPDFRPSGEARDILSVTWGEPLLTINDVAFGAVRYDDDGWEFVRGEHGTPFATLAEVSELETGSMTSGTFTYTVGRLPSGDIVTIDDLDEDPGEAVARRGTCSDLDAVKRFLSPRFTEGYVFPLLLAVFRDGKQPRYASEVDPKSSDSLEIQITVDLNDEDRARLIEWVEAQS